MGGRGGRLPGEEAGASLRKHPRRILHALRHLAQVNATVIAADDGGAAAAAAGGHAHGGGGGDPAGRGAEVDASMGGLETKTAGRLGSASRASRALLNS
jgi:hypothetical protein